MAHVPTRGLTCDLMAARVAAEFRDGWIVNFGAGMPTLCSGFVIEGRRVVFHAENGVLGFGAWRPTGSTPHRQRGHAAGGLLPSAATMHHADAFAAIGGGQLDVGVLGDCEMAANGDVANWKTAGRRGGEIRAAMDIAARARGITVMLGHTTREGAPRVPRMCSLPVIGRDIITLTITK